jgi:hypothetical protein
MERRRQLVGVNRLGHMPRHNAIDSIGRAPLSR